MNPKYLLVFILTASGLLMSGCASTSATRAPSANLAGLKSFYVAKLPADERGINQVIADQLGLMGYSATTGTEQSPPTQVDALITYQDKWMWDITMYMIQLDVQVRDPLTRMIWASAKSYRPSLQRKAPPEMAKEVLTIVLQQP